MAGVVLRAHPAAGVLATQCYSEPHLLTELVHGLSRGASSRRVMKLLANTANAPDRIQAACIDRRGQIAVKRSKACHETDIAIVRKDFVVVSNQADAAAPEAMADAFAGKQDHEDHPLAGRLLAAALAGDAAGGDTRGRLAAGIRVTSLKNPHEYGLDLRSDYSSAPLEDLNNMLQNTP